MLSLSQIRYGFSCRFSTLRFGSLAWLGNLKYCASVSLELHRYRNLRICVVGLFHCRNLCGLEILAKLFALCYFVVLTPTYHQLAYLGS
jgi:hypothetical protein